MKDMVDEVLRLGLHDWVMAAEVVSVVVSRGDSPTQRGIRDASLRILDEIFSDQLARAGDLSSAGFVPWNLTSEECMNRISQAWTESAPLPDLGDICWLELTDIGVSRARAAASS